jgi:azurin
MKKMFLFTGIAAWVLAVASLHAQTSATPASAAPATKKPRTVKLAMRDGLRFEPPRFEATPGEQLVIEIENGDSTDMAHNFLLLRPGAREAVVQAALALAEKGPAQEYIPESADILVHTRLLNPEGSAKIALTVPATPGIYPYVCTFPGHGMIMYGALYAGVTPPPLEKDPNVPPTAVQTTVAGGGKRPFAQRIFMPDAGPAAIAIALKGSQNVCWDAGQCRLRYAWQGGFIDASENWAGNGKVLPVVPTKPWWRAPKDDFPLRIGAATDAAPAVRFLGYAATPQGPVFHYRAGETEIYEQILPAAGRPGIAVRLQIPQAPSPVHYLTVSDANARWTSSAGTWNNGVLTLTPLQAVDFTLTLTSALCTP